MMKKKIVVLGASGLLGNTLYRYLHNQNSIEAIGFLRDNRDKKLFKKKFRQNLISKIDVSNISLLNKNLKRIKPDFVINCVGVVKQIIKENKSKDAVYYNSLLPHILYELSLKNKFKLLHISTDCVFDGKKGNYSENNLPNSVDLYGKTKALGELNLSDAVTIRTSYIGHEIKSAHGLLEWFLSQDKQVFGFSKALYNGLTTLELSKIIYDNFLNGKHLRGIYNVSSKPVSKHDLLCIINKTYKKSINIKKKNNVLIDRTLNSSYFRKKTGYKIKTWKKMLTELIEFEINN